ncbi:putative addiction module antidote protein [Luteolibacter sp. Populi]|uniref:putative addiction module antidote protein n=1 Tax=Luteolibacter sp. Populi TaxID=3230487 RepID=UPI0034664454
MNTIFIGGSRHVSRLPEEVRKRLDNVVAKGHQVVVGDANGADKAAQKYFLDSHYEKVTVFCSGDKPRNNLGSWQIHPVHPPKNAKGFQFYAAKDREMARKADFGLMIWDGKSPGTVLNVLRLIQAGKISVIFNVPEKVVVNIKLAREWQAFLTKCSPSLRSEIAERATPEERADIELGDQPNLPLALGPSSPSTPSKENITMLNMALASGDPTKALEMLRIIGQEIETGKFASEAGMFAPLNADKSPAFASFVKVLTSLGLRLQAELSPPPPARSRSMPRGAG